MTDPFVDQVKGAMARVSEERKASAENMRLGQFIDELAACNPALPLVLENGAGLHGFMSYRGYYEDLAISPRSDPKPVGEVLNEARAALGEIFEGYKGGEYPMHKGSLLWVAPWGSCGDKLTGVRAEADRVVVMISLDEMD